MNCGESPFAVYGLPQPPNDLPDLGMIGLYAIAALAFAIARHKRKSTQSCARAIASAVALQRASKLPKTSTYPAKYHARLDAGFRRHDESLFRR